jgi:hypothetical protein
VINRHHVAATRSNTEWRLYVDGRGTAETLTSSFADWYPIHTTDFDTLDIATVNSITIPLTFTSFTGQLYDARYTFYHFFIIRIHI